MITRYWWFAWIGCGLGCIASVAQPFTPLPFFLTLITLSWLSTGIGVLICHRQAKRQELLRKMEKAFGPSKTSDPQHRPGAQF